MCLTTPAVTVPARQALQKESSHDTYINSVVYSGA
jgi:hypothetical protein